MMSGTHGVCDMMRVAVGCRHFLFEIAKMTGDWKMENVLEEEMEKIRLQVCLKAGW